MNVKFTNVSEEPYRLHLRSTGVPEMLSKNIPTIYWSNLLKYTNVGNSGTDINKSQNTKVVSLLHILKNALRFESLGRLLGLLGPRDGSTTALETLGKIHLRK